jgi:hypothetical protein
MIEIDVPLKTIDVLYQHVLDNLGDRTLGTFPFYTKVTADLLQRAFGDWLKLDVVATAYIYAHDETIPLHVDRYNADAFYNLNVPIMVNDNDQKFIVFDQEFIDCGCEWQVRGVSQKRHQPLTAKDKENSNNDNNHLESISYKSKRPCKTKGVTGLTSDPVNDDIVDDLPFDSKFYHGLTGKSWKQIPGKGLIFKSSQLHCTGKQSKFKIGCVLLLKSQDCLLML